MYNKLLLFFSLAYASVGVCPDAYKHDRVCFTGASYYAEDLSAMPLWIAIWSTVLIDFSVHVMMYAAPELDLEPVASKFAQQVYEALNNIDGMPELLAKCKDYALKYRVEPYVCDAFFQIFVCVATAFDTFVCRQKELCVESGFLMLMALAAMLAHIRLLDHCYNCKCRQ